MPVDIMIGTHVEGDAIEETQFVAVLRDLLQSAYENVRKYLNIAADRQKRYYDWGFWIH